MSRLKVDICPGNGSESKTVSAFEEKEAIQYCATAHLRNAIFVMGLIASCFKMLLINAEHSTDMDVHLHWKALTHMLPLSDWYTDKSSQWTLDYPPLFAYFELFLSYFSPFHHVLAAHATSRAQILYLRLTVLATDPILYSGIYSLILAMRTVHGKEKLANTADLAAAALAMFCPPLILVDNVHFQYNGLPLGILLHSLASFVAGKCALGVVLYAVSINLKHTLLPLAPVLAFVTLRILYRDNNGSIVSIPFLQSFFLVLSAFLISFMVPWIPFFLTGGFRAAISRLFPFGRGLLHSYWAPNFWAPYAALDRILSRLGCAVREVDGVSTSGLIGASVPFATLPNVTPKHCAALIISAIIPVLVFVRKKRDAPIAAVYGALTSFVFGWHVHEKNVLVALIPFAAILGAEHEPIILWAFSMLAVGGSFGVFPLLVSERIVPFKISLFVGYSVFLTVTMWKRVKMQRLRFVWVSYMLGTLIVEWYAGIGGGHHWLFSDRFEFLPLLVVSLYSSTGVIAALIGLFCGLPLKSPESDIG